MSSFTVVVQATKPNKFEKISKSKIFTGNWRKQFEPLITKVLEANLFDCKYPEVQIEISINSGVAVELEVSNIGTEDKMKLLWPRLAEDGELEFESLSYCIKVAQGNIWTLNFMEGSFSAGSASFKNYLSNHDGLEITGRFVNFDALDKQLLIRLMLNKLDVFFTFKNNFSPEEVIDVICQALCVKFKNFQKLKISMGYLDILEIEDSEIVQAVEKDTDYTIRLDFQKYTTYEENGFSLCEQSMYQKYKWNFATCFNDAECPDEELNERLSDAKKKIINFLHGIALYNENAKK